MKGPVISDSLKKDILKSHLVNSLIDTIEVIREFSEIYDDEDVVFVTSFIDDVLDLISEEDL